MITGEKKIDTISTASSIEFKSGLSLSGCKTIYEFLKSNGLSRLP